MDLPPSVEKGKCNPKRKRPRCFGFELYFNDSICSIAGDFVFIEVVVVVVVVVPPATSKSLGFGLALGFSSGPSAFHQHKKGIN